MKKKTIAKWTGIVSLVVLFGATMIYMTLPGPSIYRSRYRAEPLPLLQYLNSDNYLTIEYLTQHFEEHRDTILTELGRLNDDNYVERVFEDGLYYYRLTEWGVVYMNYLEERRA